MTRYVGASEAARQLGVRRETLYAYVSRGLIGRRVAVDGRTSLYSTDDLDALAGRTRRRVVEPRPSLDVQIATAVATLDEDGVRYRGHDVATLARTCTFEQVAELLWTGDLPTRRDAGWAEPDAADARLVTRAARAVRSRGVPALLAAANALDAATPPNDDPAVAARRLLRLAPVALGGGPAGGGLAERLAACWAKAPSGAPELAPAVDRALVLLADHELATSTLAVRLAGSVRANPYAAFAAGLGVIRGPLHGGATAAAVELLAESRREGAAATVARRLDRGERLPGFGHKIYAGDDPRLAPLLEAVDTLPDPGGRSVTVHEVIAAASGRLVRRPNVDLGLGALLFVAGLPADTPIFAVARIAGFAAHLAEETDERPVRYRGIARA
jgi:citrate synthase